MSSFSLIAPICTVPSEVDVEMSRDDEVEIPSTKMRTRKYMFLFAVSRVVINKKINEEVKSLAINFSLEE